MTSNTNEVKITIAGGVSVTFNVHGMAALKTRGDEAFAADLAEVLRKHIVDSLKAIVEVNDLEMANQPVIEKAAPAQVSYRNSRYRL